MLRNIHAKDTDSDGSLITMNGLSFVSLLWGLGDCVRRLFVLAGFRPFRPAYIIGRLGDVG